jgi:hypothetical protein
MSLSPANPAEPSRLWGESGISFDHRMGRGSDLLFKALHPSQNRSTLQRLPRMVPPDGSKNRESPEDCGADEVRKGAGFLPGDVSRRVFGPDAERAQSLETGRPEITKVRSLISLSQPG